MVKQSKISAAAITADDADAAPQELQVHITGPVKRHVSVADATGLPLTLQQRVNARRVAVGQSSLCSNCGKLPIAPVPQCFSDWCELCDNALWVSRDDENSASRPNHADGCSSVAVAAVDCNLNNLSDHHAVPAASVSVSISSSVASTCGHRDKFKDSCLPWRVCCDLRSVGLLAAGVRFACQAVIYVVYPPSEMPPRRHVLLLDSTGCTGLTVWGVHVPLFTDATVGTVVNLANLRLDIFNGQMCLSMGKDSCAAFLPNTIKTVELQWWQSLPDQGTTNIADILNCAVDTVVNVSGIVGSVANGSITLVDRTGWVRVKSLDPAEFEFSLFINHPLQLQRVRVTIDNGAIILMILSGGGTIIQSHFTGDAELLEYWTSAV
jgi:hypothetical protein